MFSFRFCRFNSFLSFLYKHIIVFMKNRFDIKIIPVDNIDFCALHYVVDKQRKIHFRDLFSNDEPSQSKKLFICLIPHEMYF